LGIKSILETKIFPVNIQEKEQILHEERDINAYGKIETGLFHTLSGNVKQ